MQTWQIKTRFAFEQKRLVDRACFQKVTREMRSEFKGKRKNPTKSVVEHSKFNLHKFMSTQQVPVKTIKLKHGHLFLLQIASLECADKSNKVLLLSYNRFNMALIASHRRCRLNLMEEKFFHQNRKSEQTIDEETKLRIYFQRRTWGNWNFHPRVLLEWVFIFETMAQGDKRLFNFLLI